MWQLQFIKKETDFKALNSLKIQSGRLDCLSADMGHAVWDNKRTVNCSGQGKFRTANVSDIVV